MNQGKTRPEREKRLRLRLKEDEQLLSLEPVRSTLQALGQEILQRIENGYSPTAADHLVIKRVSERPRGPGRPQRAEQPTAFLHPGNRARVLLAHVAVRRAAEVGRPHEPPWPGDEIFGGSGAGSKETRRRPRC